MKPEEQRIAIAEWCGWKMANSETLDVGYCEPTPYGLDCPQQTIPDYLNDLNAIHEAEERLNEIQRKEYERRLDEPGDGYSCWPQLHATAAKRAEALLRTMRKWQDDATQQLKDGV